MADAVVGIGGDNDLGVAIRDADGRGLAPGAPVGAHAKAAKATIAQQAAGA